VVLAGLEEHAVAPADDVNGAALALAEADALGAMPSVIGTDASCGPPVLRRGSDEDLIQRP
jgi:hypothetical protein